MSDAAAGLSQSWRELLDRLTPPAVLLFLLAASPLLAGPEDLGVELHTIAVADFPKMRVTLSLIDRTGRALKGLEGRNFRVYEDGRRGEIDEVTVDRTPVIAALCVDSSGSMTTAIDSVKRAAGLFIRLLDEDDQAEIIGFADEPRIVSPRTGDKAVLLGRLQRLVPYGATAFHDALWRALLDLQGLTGRRVIVAMTDGQDQNRDGTALLSRRSLAQVLKRAKADGIPIYTIGLGRRILKEQLLDIAEKTGGKAYFAPKPSSLENIYLQIAANLKSQVVLNYRSPNTIRDGRWRPLEVRASADERQGSGRELFRAPGKYVLELSGQGYDRLKLSELAQELPAVRLYDSAVAQLLDGKPSDLLGWLLRYFQRPGAESAPSKKADGASAGPPPAEK